MSNNPNQQPGDFVHKLPHTWSLGGKTLSQLDPDLVEAYFTLTELKRIKLLCSEVINHSVAPNSLYYRPQFINAIHKIDEIITNRLRLVQEKHAKTNDPRTIADVVDEVEDLLADSGYSDKVDVIIRDKKPVERPKEPEELPEEFSEESGTDKDDESDEEDYLDDALLMSEILVVQTHGYACHKMVGAFGRIEWVDDDADTLIFLNGERLYWEDMGKRNLLALLKALHIKTKRELEEEE